MILLDILPIVGHLNCSITVCLSQHPAGCQCSYNAQLEINVPVFGIIALRWKIAGLFGYLDGEGRLTLSRLSFCSIHYSRAGNLDECCLMKGDNSSSWSSRKKTASLQSMPASQALVADSTWGKKTETLETLETLAANPIHTPQSPEHPFGGARSAMLSPPRSASLLPPRSATLSPRPTCTHAEILNTSSTKRGDSFALTAFGIPLTMEILDNLVFDPESSCNTSSVGQLEMSLAIEVLNNMVFDPEPLCGTPSAELAMPLAIEILDNIDLATDVQMESLGDDTDTSLNYVAPVMEVFDH
ncbi:predicted protein [Postia placenta Mad-698-R]|nr:predicted protein [Postia placenta Mad-698-R]